MSTCELCIENFNLFDSLIHASSSGAFFNKAYTRQTTAFFLKRDQFMHSFYAIKTNDDGRDFSYLNVETCNIFWKFNGQENFLSILKFDT